ncbi:MAG: hypothetical protein V3T12_08645 [Acidiferrobacterales bacterium]|jgi:hypothetical protein|nr:hypothetical protein [Nitrospira sp.]
MKRKSTRRQTGAERVERIGIIVVHGVGEQKRFEYLEAIASNLCKALAKNRRRQPHIQLRYGDQGPRLALNSSWRDAPALVRWRKPGGGWIEVNFREVHWADLDMPKTWGRWVKLIGWALGVSGVRLYLQGRVGAPRQHGMCAPKGLSVLERLRVRASLFLVSLFFLFMLVTLNVVRWLLNRVSLRIAFLNNMHDLIYNYLGDVKLYQDWFPRSDERIETVGEKSRVAIRRRMIRVLVQTANEVAAGRMDGYYVFAHSLGTVAAFNALMETDLALANYLTEAEWNDLPSSLKKKVTKALPKHPMPQRPPWLDQPKAGGRHDAIDRKRLFQGLRGFLTLGSPLDKFASLWPAIVPVNSEAIGPARPWINVADVQDIVAGRLDKFPVCKPAAGTGGLALRNIDWAAEWSLATAHTSYWKVRRKTDRLMDCVVLWLEGGRFQDPPNVMLPGLARLISVLTFIVGTGLLVWGFAAAVWLLANADEKLGMPFSESFIETLTRWGLREEYSAALLPAIGYIVAIGLVIVMICSVARRIWENEKFG